MNDEKKGLRQADFLTSFLLIGIAIWVFVTGLRMPMTGTYGGVQSQWYVSPGLLPMIVGALLGFLALALLVNSIRSGGARVVTEVLKRRDMKLQESHIRFGAIMLAFVTYVFLNIPRVDFFLATATFLMFFIGAFYPNDDRVLHRLTLFYLIEQCVLFLVFVTGLGAALNSVLVYRMVEYGTDVVAIVILVTLWIYFAHLTRGRDEFHRLRRTTVLIAFLFPLVLTPLFRYALRVRLPHEGGIIELFHLVYYAIR